ncbi:MAG TPA: hypothetical protein VF131_26765 [Blastocatellia bacterium]|nr:hypothetical protein [Blastocatellia bacterium]
MQTRNKTHAHKQNEVVTHRPPGQCVSVPDFKRLNYFYGQMLGAADFQAEQNYFREKLKLHNRCLHGYGTVCGLEVVPEPADPHCPSPADEERDELERELQGVEEEITTLQANNAQEAGGDAPDYQQRVQELNAMAEDVRRRIERHSIKHCKEEKPTTLHVLCGMALDCEGNELVVRQPLKVDLWRALSRDDRKRIEDIGHDIHARFRNDVTLYLSICYCEQAIEPVRPVIADTCGAVPDCTYGKIRDSVHVRVTLDPPDEDKRCGVCCEACADPCLLLARIDGFRRGRPIEPENIFNEVRRPLGLYTATTITGINWVHGATYKKKDVEKILGTHGDEDDLDETSGGIVIEFSRPVLTSSITKGVVDLWVIKGGQGERAGISNTEGEFMDLPSTPTTTRIRYRQVTRESVQYGDRILITVRTAFILDECCRPVDGTHIGGRVPLVADAEEINPLEQPRFDKCVFPPPGYGPWTSGSASSGQSFESWFYVRTQGK